MKIFRRLFRLALYLFIAAVALVVAGILLLNTFAKEALVSRLRATTGLDPRIGQIDIGLLSPTIDVENFKLYNTAAFGGGIFVDMPELHLEYDASAIRSGQLHFKLVRLDLEEFSLIQDKAGHMNVQGLEKKGQARAAEKKAPGKTLVFTGIDTLNLTLGKFRLSNLANGKAQELDFGIKNQIAHNVKNQNDVPGLNILFAAAGGTLASTNATIDLSALLQGLTAR
jgi:uncharacterized protein involved in outer membrane biogenesis